MKPNVIIALLVGAAVGFFAGKMVGNNTGNSPVIAAAPSPSPSGGGQAAPGAVEVLKVPLDNSPVSGKADALVTIVEFSDYQCPFCSRGNTTIKQLQQDYGDKVRVAMKQNPLSFHPFARPAALAALSAGEQGKYWEMHHKMFENATALDDASLEKYATEIGLNIPKWKEDLKQQKFADIIAADQALAGKLGATGTPAFFINGIKLSGAQPIGTFKQVIDGELKKAQDLVKGGVSADQVYAKIMMNAKESPAPQAAAPSPNPSAPRAPPPPASVRKINVPDDSPSKGPKNAKVTVVLWSDFQCPFCSRVVPTMKQIEETYGKDVKMVFRHQPLPFHDKAKVAAEASMAAHEQGKFWQMHDKMFANQQALDRPALEKYASEIGLDMGKFKGALDSGKFRAKVEADSAEGSQVGANGTPTFFINGREFVGAQPFDAFKPMIESELKRANDLLAKGVKPDQLYTKLIEDAIANAPAAPPAAAPGAPPEAKVVDKINLNGAPIKGPKNAPVTIVAFSDFQCPFCSRVVQTLKDVEKQYDGKVRVAFKHQPLPFHDKAKGAAMASMAAHEQGKFWEMHDKLFANQQALDRPALDKYASELGLDMGKFRSAMDSNKFDAQITKDSNEGTQIGASGTPTFFINGRQLVGAQPIDAFKTIIDDELKKKKGKN